MLTSYGTAHKYVYNSTCVFLGVMKESRGLVASDVKSTHQVVLVSNYLHVINTCEEFLSPD